MALLGHNHGWGWGGGGGLVCMGLVPLGYGWATWQKYHFFFFFLNMFHDFIDSLSCLFFYFASCLSITAKLISLL